MKMIRHKRLVKSKGKHWVIAIDDGYVCYKFSKKECSNLSIKDVADKICFNMSKWSEEVK